MVATVRREMTSQLELFGEFFNATNDTSYSLKPLYILRRSESSLRAAQNEKNPFQQSVPSCPSRTYRANRTSAMNEYPNHSLGLFINCPRIGWRKVTST